MYRHAYRNFVASRRAFLRQSAALAGITAAAPLISGLGAGRLSAAAGATYADDLWAKTVDELKGGDFRKSTLTSTPGRGPPRSRCSTPSR